MSAGDFDTRWLGSRVIVAMPAEVDVTNTDQAREALLAVTRQRPAVLVINMGETTFCDSAGVQAIVAAYRQAAGTPTELRLVATSVKRILSLVGIGELIPIHPTVEAALAAS